MAKSAQNLAQSIYSSLADRAAKLPDPRDYYRGRRAEVLAVPDDVLMFCRRSPTELGRRASVHHRFVLAVPLSGEVDTIVDRRTHHLSPGRAMLVFPYQFHAYRPTRDAQLPSPLRWLFITFVVDHEQPLAPLRDQTLHLTETDLSDLTDMLDDWQRSAQRMANVQLRLASLLSHLAARRPRRSRKHQRTLTVAPDPDLIERIAHLVYEHLDEPVPVEWLADELAMSPSALRQRMRRACGMSVSAYVRRVKMLRAMKLLRSTDTSITDIAYACGYSSVYAFSRSFSQSVGTSPRAYRTQPT